MKAVSVIVPTYNESANLPIFIEKVNKIFSRKGITGEVIVIDDNSPDGTGQLAERLRTRYKFLKVIHRPSKLGLGSAYKEGFRVAKGKLLFTMDADLSHDPTCMPRFIGGAERADVVVGSRYVEGGGIEGWGIYRKLVSKVANFLASIVVRADVKDITSGYRAYRREVLAKTPLKKIRSSGYAFQLEMIYEVKRRGFKIDSVPIVFTDRRKGKSKLGMREIFSFLMLTIKLGLRR
jgi:dolichol-phosphate mannosyltransferase